MLDANIIDLVQITRIATFTWLFLWAVLGVRTIIFKRYYSICIIIIFHFIFFGIPILLDIIVGEPNYYKLSASKYVFKDETTFFVYCLYVSVAPVIIWFTGRPRKSRQSLRLAVNSRSLLSSLNNLNLNYKLGKNLNLCIRIACYFLLILPGILWFLSPNPGIYSTYGAKGAGIMSEAELSYHSLIYRASIANLCGLTGLIILQKKHKLSLLNFYFWMILLVPTGISIWLNGKRHIVAYVIFLVAMLLLIKGFLKGRKLLIFLTIMVFVFGFFSYSYQTSLVRSIQTSLIYEQSRLDFARDHLLKASIYSELNPEKMQILDYRGQTVFNALILGIPRIVWTNKPLAYDYKKYLTAAVRNRSIESLNSGITATWLGEALSNFGWLGILIGPLVLSLFCRIGDASNNKFIMILTSLTALRLMLLSLGSVVLMFAVWSIFMLRDIYKKKRNKHSSLRIS